MWGQGSLPARGRGLPLRASLAARTRASVPTWPHWINRWRRRGRSSSSICRRWDARVWREGRRSRREHSEVGHPVIAVGMVGRHVALIAEEEKCLVPRNVRASREQLVKALGSGAARQGDGEPAICVHGAFGQRDKLSGSGLKQILGARQDANSRWQWHAGIKRRN